MNRRHGAQRTSRVGSAGAGPPKSKSEAWNELPTDTRRALRTLEFGEAIGNRITQRQGRWGAFRTSLRQILADKFVVKIIDSTLAYSEFLGPVERAAIKRVADRVAQLEARVIEYEAGLVERNRRKH